MPEVSLSNNVLGIQAVHVGYVDAGVRYWTSDGRFALGIGELLWNQQAKYIDSQSLIEFDASRGVGARYEVAARMPAAKDRTVDLSVALSPSIHALLSYTFVPSFVVRPPVAQSESQVDASAGYTTRTRSGHFSCGLPYINLTGRLPDGDFADQNKLIMGFFKVSARLGR